MTDKPDLPENRDDTDAVKASAPTGAVLVTTFLTVVILVFWFGTYLFNVLRS